MANQKDNLSDGTQNVLSNIPSGSGGGTNPISDISFSTQWKSTGQDATVSYYGAMVVNDWPTLIPAGGLSIVGNPPSATAGLSETVSNTAPFEKVGVSFALPSNGAIDFQTTIKLSNHASVFYQGMSSLSISNFVATDPTTVDSLLCGCDGISANYLLIVSKAGAVHKVDSGVAIDANRHLVELKLVAGVATMLLDGIVVATYSGADIPTAPLGVVWYLPAGAAMTADFEFAIATCPTP